MNILVKTPIFNIVFSESKCIIDDKRMHLNPDTNTYESGMAFMFVGSKFDEIVDLIRSVNIRLRERIEKDEILSSEFIDSDGMFIHPDLIHAIEQAIK